MMQPGAGDLQVQQAPWMKAPKRWPLVQQPSNRSTSFTKDARLVNCYAEKQPDGQYDVEKRFGLGPVAWTLGSPGVRGQGLFNLNLGLTQNSTLMIANNVVNQLVFASPGGGLP